MHIAISALCFVVVVAVSSYNIYDTITTARDWKRRGMEGAGMAYFFTGIFIVMLVAAVYAAVWAFPRI